MLARKILVGPGPALAYVLDAVLPRRVAHRRRVVRRAASGEGFGVRGSISGPGSWSYVAGVSFYSPQVFLKTRTQFSWASFRSARSS